MARSIQRMPDWFMSKTKESNSDKDSRTKNGQNQKK